MENYNERRGTGGYRQRSSFGSRAPSNRFSTVRLLAQVALVALGVSLLTWFLCYAKS